MADSADPILAFGYRLGGPNSGWKIKYQDPFFDPIELSWCDADAEEGFIEQAEKRLKEDAPEAVGVTFVGIGFRYEDYLLAIHPDIEQVTDEDGLLDPRKLSKLAFYGNYEAKLMIALYALKITPTQKKPGWILEAACE